MVTFDVPRNAIMALEFFGHVVSFLLSEILRISIMLLYSFDAFRVGDFALHER